MASKKVENAKFKRWWQQARDARSELDWKWFKYDLWVNGNHYAKWDKNSQSIVAVKSQDGKPKLTINKTYAVLRGVRNYTLRNQPRAQVSPVDLSPENVDQAKDLNRFLDYLHDKLRLRRKLRASVWHALKYSVGYWQIMWDEDEQEIKVTVVDPYDLYWDPAAHTPEEARYVVLAVRRSIGDLKTDEKYKKVDWDHINADNELSSSSMKSRIMKHERGDPNMSKKDEGTVILRETWYKQYNEKEGVDEIWITAHVGEEEVRKPEKIDLTRLPFFCVQSDVEPLSLYGQGWVKNLIPLNRALNMLESSVAEYNNLVNKGKWIADRTAGVRVINSEHGQIIEKKRGTDVGAAPIPPMNPNIFNQIENMNRYFEDIGAMHDATRGRVPAGAKSGIAIEMLQIGDSNNLAELQENVEDFLEEAYEYMLQLAADKYQFARNISPIDASTGERDFVAFIGEGAENEPEGVTVIPRENMVDVKITSWLADTAEARRDTLKDLFAMQAIDQETLLKGYEIGNVADIIANTRVEKEDEMINQAALTRASNPEPAQPRQGVREAIAFIREILEDGQVPPLPPQVTQEFVDYLDSFIRNEGESVPEDVLQLLRTARNEAQRTVVN